MDRYTMAGNGMFVEPTGEWAKYSDVEALQAQLENSVSLDQLKDSNFVHVNILRGMIALTRRQALHIGGAEQLHKDYEKLQSRVRELEGLVELMKADARNAKGSQRGETQITTNGTKGTP